MEEDFISIKDNLNDTLTRLKELENSKNGMTGISTGFVDLDYAIKGLNKSNLIVIGSRPAIGKTAFALNIATHVAVNENIPVAIFSLDMSREQCTKRILSSQILVENSKLNTGKLNDEEWQKVIKTSEQLSNAEIYINDILGISINEIREKAINLKQQKNIGLIVVDYLQLIQSNKKCNTREEDSEVSSALKELAQELNIPIIVLYQLPSRAQRSDKRPILSDLQNDVVKNSDVVMFLYRDDYYNPDSEMKSIAEVIIAKNRYGTSNNTTVELLFRGEYLRFDNLEKRFDDTDVANVFDLQSKENKLKQELECLKKYTNILDNIRIEDVKQLYKNYLNKDIYVLLHNGDLYISGVLHDTNVNELFTLAFDENIYKIKKDNIIIPMKDIEEWEDLDFYLYNENKPYKKIITYDTEIIALTLDNKVVAVSFHEFIGIIPENFIDVDDIFLKEQKNGRSEPYIIKQEEEKPLYILKEW